MRSALWIGAIATFALALGRLALALADPANLF